MGHGWQPQRENLGAGSVMQQTTHPVHPYSATRNVAQTLNSAHAGDPGTQSLGPNLLAADPSAQALHPDMRIDPLPTIVLNVCGTTIIVRSVDAIQDRLTQALNDGPIGDTLTLNGDTLTVLLVILSP